MLPAGFAPATATATATRPSTAATRTTTAARTAATAAATAKSTAAATTAAAESAVGFGTRLVDVQGPAVQRVAVQRGNGLIRLGFVLHFDEREPPGPAGVAVGHDAGAVHGPVSFKQAAYSLFSGVEISYDLKAGSSGLERSQDDAVVRKHSAGFAEAIQTRFEYTTPDAQVGSGQEG
jgi:hypothetical protein